MLTSEVIIDEQRCHGCGYCVQFCPRECLVIPGGGVSPLGYEMPVFAHPERCNTCGFCSQMCPHWAVNVYLSIKEDGKAAVREKVAGLPRLTMAPPLANCSWCQHPLVGRIVTEVLDELGVDGEAVALEAISCSNSSVFGIGFSRMLTAHDRPSEIASVTKRAQPDALVFLVQDNLYIPMTADSFISALVRGEKFTMIMCTDINRASDREQLAPVTSITEHERRILAVEGYPLHTAELVSTFKGVAYSARGALTSPDSYQRTKSYIRTAFQKQKDNAGFSFVEVLCICADCQKYLDRADCLKWVRDSIITDFPLGEFKNVDRIG